MSNNNELYINNNYVKIKKRKPNRILDLKQEINNHECRSQCLTLEKGEDNFKTSKIKTHNRRINVSKSYNNFYNNKINTENKNDENEKNNKINLLYQKINFVPRINRHKRNLAKYININLNKDEEETKKMPNKTLYQKQNNTFNKSYTNFNSFYKRKKRYFSTEENVNNNSNNYYNNNNNFNYNKYLIENTKESEIILKKIRQNSTIAYPKERMTNITYSITTPKYVCKNCFDKEMLEGQSPSISNSVIHRKEILAEKFINENPFYFVDKMRNFEKKRIQKKIDTLSEKQRQVLPVYEKEINKPKNLKKEKLQLINEYSLNPLAIEHGKDPKFLQYKIYFDEKEKIIQNNPDIYPGLVPRKAFQDYYEKCMYQIPNSEEIYTLNPVYKKNYIKVLKKQIDDKVKEEKDYLKKTKTAECFANKQFNEYKKNEKLNELRKTRHNVLLLNKDNKKLDNYKKTQEEKKIKEEEKFIKKLNLLKDKENKDYKLRYKKEKFMDCELYQKMFDDMNRRHDMNIYNKKEENRKWNNYLDKYIMRYGYKNRYNNCDRCNRPIQTSQQLKQYPPPKSSYVNANYNY